MSWSLEPYPDASWNRIWVSSRKASVQKGNSVTERTKQLVNYSAAQHSANTEDVNYSGSSK